MAALPGDAAPVPGPVGRVRTPAAGTARHAAQPGRAWPGAPAVADRGDRPVGRFGVGREAAGAAAQAVDRPAITVGEGPGPAPPDAARGGGASPGGGGPHL